MWEYNYTPNSDELYHYGVPGMKWGTTRRERRFANKLRKAGWQQGLASDAKRRGKYEMGKNEEKAKLFEAQAKKSGKKGDVFRQYASQKTADAIRIKGADKKASYDASSAAYKAKADKLRAKAMKYAEKKKINVGQDTINKIMNSSAKISAGDGPSMREDMANTENRIRSQVDKLKKKR